MVLSNILDKIGTTEIGLQLLGDRSPFVFIIQVIFADFHDSYLYA